MYCYLAAKHYNSKKDNLVSYYKKFMKEVNIPDGLSFSTGQNFNVKNKNGNRIEIGLKIREEALMQIQLNQNKYKNEFDKSAKERDIEVGNFVYVKKINPSKLDELWIGPFKVIEKISKEERDLLKELEEAKKELTELKKRSETKKVDEVVPVPQIPPQMPPQVVYYQYPGVRSVDPKLTDYMKQQILKWN